MDRAHLKRLVEQGYDRVAEQYLATKDPADPFTLATLEQLASGLPPDAAVLDLGCGAGLPVTQWLAERFAVTGVDISEAQLALARRHAPGASLIHADMLDLSFPPASFDAVVSFYAIIHVARTEQPALVRRIHRWLKPGGVFLALWAIDAWEGEDLDWEGWGAAMAWSHHDAPTSLAMLEEAGFQVVSARRATSAGETWLWVVGTKA